MNTELMERPITVETENEEFEQSAVEYEPTRLERLQQRLGELAGEGMDALRWRYNQVQASLTVRSQAAAARRAEAGMSRGQASLFLMGALVVDAAAYRTTGYGTGLLDSLSPDDAALLQQANDHVQAMGAGSGLQHATDLLAQQVIPPVDVPPADDNPWVWNPIENWYESQTVPPREVPSGPVVCDPAAPTDPAACAEPGPIVTPTAPALTPPPVPDVVVPPVPPVPDVTLAPVPVPDVTVPPVPEVTVPPVPEVTVPPVPDVVPDVIVVPDAVPDVYNYEKPNLSGKYLWNLMDNSGVPDGDIMPLLDEAAKEAAQHGHEIEWHGSGTHRWLEIDDETETKILWEILKPYLNKTS